MSNEVVTYPWDATPAVQTTEHVVALLQRDMQYILRYTAVAVHSSRPELRMLVNTKRGQIVPRNEVKYADGTTLEFQDIGAPQIGIPEMTVKELVLMVVEKANELGLKL